MSKNTIIKYAIYVLLGVLLIFTTAVLCSCLFKDYFSDKTYVIGDTLGGTTAPFIGLLSVFLLYYTFKEQREFNNKQREYNERQTQLARDDQFKSSFFMLLQEQRDILKSLSTTCVTLKESTINKVRHKVEGQEFFAMAIWELRLLFQCMDMSKYQSGYDQQVASDIMESIQSQLYTGFNLPKELEAENDDMINGAKIVNWQKYLFDKFHITQDEFERYNSMVCDEKLEYVYSKFFNIYENCGYYFRHLYRLLRHIDDAEKEESSLSNDLDYVAKKYKQYAEYIQAQMSTNEMLMVFYNCFLFDKARKLIIKYEILQNLSKQNLLMEQHQRLAAEFKLKDKPTYKWVK